MKGEEEGAKKRGKKIVRQACMQIGEKTKNRNNNSKSYYRSSIYKLRMRNSFYFSFLTGTPGLLVCISAALRPESYGNSRL